jgi:microcystin-dependent protein
MKKLMIILAATIALSAAAIETTIAYQGVLRDAQGNVLSVHSQLITFRLYSQASGGTPLWARAVTVNLDSNGLFNVELSDAGTPVAGATYTTLVEALKAARSGALFVGLEVADSSGEISPRQKILMTPYSSWAADVTNASSDFSVSGKATLNSAEVSSGLTVNGATTLKGNTTFDNNVTIKGKLTVNSTGTLAGYGTIPVGGIIMWSGTSVPDGWALCNGANGTPDLRNRFVMGKYNVGDTNSTGGREYVTLSVSNLPAHSHLYAGDDQMDHIGDGNYKAWDNVVSRPGSYDAKSETSGAGTIFRTSSTGSGSSFSILPPYYKLAFIMRVK